jgi:hypothetical protein
MTQVRQGTIRVGARDLQIGQLNVTHPMSPSVADGATPWRFWDSTLGSILESVIVQVLDMHPIQRWPKPEDASALAQLVVDVPEVRDVTDATICASANGFVGTQGLCAGRSCESCPHALANRCKRYMLAYVRLIEPADPLPRQMRMGWASRSTVTRITCETEMLGAAAWMRVFTLAPGKRDCKVGNSGMVTIASARDATDDERAAAEEMHRRYVQGRVAAVMASIDVPTVLELANGAEMPALTAPEADHEDDDPYGDELAAEAPAEGRRRK